MRNGRSLQRRDRDWSLLCFKFPPITSKGTFLSNLKSFLTSLAFFEPNVIERRWCIDYGTILRPLDVGVDLTRRVKNVHKAFIRQRMIQRGIVEDSLKVVVMNHMELWTDMISLEVSDGGD
jgi:hypothetical protein